MVKFLVPIISFLALTGCEVLKNRILIENDSALICSAITVTVCDSNWTIHSMAPGEQWESTVVYTRDDHFQVLVEMDYGQTLEGNFGYVTHGITGDLVEISFTGDSISFSQSISSY